MGNVYMATPKMAICANGALVLDSVSRMHVGKVHARFAKKQSATRSKGYTAIRWSGLQLR